MRYTEVAPRRARAGADRGLDENTVDFQPNYSTASSSEPTVLPARFPNLLVNGAGGIAVGMATNIPPHNLGEIIDATLAVMDQPEIDLEELHADRARAGFPDRRRDPGPRRHPLRLHDGPRLDPHAGQGRGRGDPARARGADRHRDPLSGEQDDADREDRRTRAREARRGHLGAARRIRPRRHAHRHRAQARRRGRRRAEPALALQAAAVQLRRQHDRAERRPARGPDPQGLPRRLRRLPRGGGHAAHQVPPRQGAQRAPTSRSASPSRWPISTR